MKNLIIYLITMTMMVSCYFHIDSSSKNLTINNYTDEAIYVYYTYYDSIQLTPKLELFVYWPDRAPDEKDLDQYCSPEYRVNPHFYSLITGDHSSETKWIPFPDKNYVNFFFIKESTMKNYTWEEIVQKQLYERKVKYTYDELEKLNYEIIYKL